MSLTRIVFVIIFLTSFASFGQIDLSVNSRGGVMLKRSILPLLTKETSAADFNPWLFDNALRGRLNSRKREIEAELNFNMLDEVLKVNVSGRLSDLTLDNLVSFRVKESSNERTFEVFSGDYIGSEKKNVLLEKLDVRNFVIYIYREIIFSKGDFNPALGIGERPKYTMKAHLFLSDRKGVQLNELKNRKDLFQIIDDKGEIKQYWKDEKLKFGLDSIIRSLEMVSG